MDGPSTTTWDDDAVQFPRLIAEIEAAGGFTVALVNDLCASMDVEPENVHELVDRAQARWDALVAGTEAS